MLTIRSILVWLAAVAVPAAISLVVGFVVTLLLLPLWRWLESAHGIESIGHSGPADWCYSLTTLVVFLPLLVISVRLALSRQRAA